MTPQRRPHAATRMQGHTLPELLIGLTLGLLIIAAATTVYGVSQQSWTAMAAADALHANARVALRNLREQAQMLGGSYLEEAPNHTVRVSLSEDAGQAALAGLNGSKTTESVTLGHWHALDAVDCQGNSASTHSTVRNDFKLNTHKELTCKDLNLSNSTYQALAEGVEDFQVRYAQANPANQTLQWLSADQVTDMSHVMAIEVCLRMASLFVINSPISTSTKSKGCLDEALVTDGRLRRVFKRVIALRNREGVLP
jgi:type IV pilus assembly protein PilW